MLYFHDLMEFFILLNISLYLTYGTALVPTNPENIPQVLQFQRTYYIKNSVFSLQYRERKKSLVFVDIVSERMYECIFFFFTIFHKIASARVFLFKSGAHPKSKTFHRKHSITRLFLEKYRKLSYVIYLYNNHRNRGKLFP